ncbi:MAG: SDR family NAD(P)-dependent oxidoreductase [Candidatus Dormibacteria bacterium]
MKDIGGRVAVITGASRGLGQHIARHLLDHGMKVVLAARTADELEAVRKELDRSGRVSLAVPTDVSVEADRVALLAAARERFGAVDVLVNNAGIEVPQAFELMEWERVEAIMRVNVLSLMRLTQLVLPEMLERGSGHVVNIASLAGLTPVPFQTIYSASKHAVVGFSQSLRYEVADRGVGISAVCPSFVRDAGMFTRWAGGGESAGAAGTVSPDEVGEAVVSAIRKNRATVVVSAMAGMPAPAISSISPDLMFRLMKGTGLASKLRRAAEVTQQQIDSRAGGPALQRRRP